MISIGTSGISDISIGNTSVSKVYFGNETNPVWQKVTEVPTTLIVNNTSGDVLAATMNIYKTDTTPTIVKLNGTQIASSSTSGQQGLSVSIVTGQCTIEIFGGEWYFNNSYCLGDTTNNSYIQSITFGDNYGNIIGFRAFQGASISSIILPDGIVEIKSYAFCDCSLLTSFTMSGSVTKIDSDAFSGCTNLATVNYTGSIADWCRISFYETVSNPVFYAHHLYINGNLLSGTLTIPSEITSIKKNAFVRFFDITKVVGHSSLTGSIGQNAFLGCINLSTIELYAIPSSIDNYAFAWCNLSAPTPNMYNCTSLGLACFAFRNAWSLSNISSSVATRLVNRDMPNNSWTIDGVTYNLYGRTYAANMSYYLQYNDNGGGPWGNAQYYGNITIDGTTTNNVWGFYTGYSNSIGNIDEPADDNKCFVCTAGSTPTISHSNTLTAQNNVDSWTSELSVTSLTHGSLVTCQNKITINGTCLVEGTLITLADGTKKPVEDVTYDDLLLVYNFETGAYDYQYPTLLSAGNAEYITRITLEDDSYLDIAGVHDLYDPVRHEFVAWGRGNFDDDTAVTYHLWKEVDGKLKIMKVKSKKIIQEPKRCYACMTGGTLTAFANDILVGSVLLNFAGISQEDKFYPKFQEDKKKAVTYEYFKDNIYNKANKYLTMSLNLQYLDFYYNPDTVDFDGLYAPFINSPIKPPKQGDKIVCNIAYIEGEKVTVEKHLEDEEITLPQITEKGKTKWYVVGEYKYLNAGDKLKVNFSTTIRAV